MDKGTEEHPPSDQQKQNRAMSTGTSEARLPIGSGLMVE